MSDEYKYYIENYNRFITSKRDMSASMDKYILIYASGSITLSITLIPNLFESDHIIFGSTLLLSWLFSVLSISAILISFYASQKSFHFAADEETARYEKKIKDQSIAKENRKKYDRQVSKLNHFGIVCIFLSTFFLLCFCGINMNNKSNFDIWNKSMHDKDKLDYGGQTYSQPPAKNQEKETTDKAPPSQEKK